LEGLLKTRQYAFGLPAALPSRHLCGDPRLEQFDLHAREQISFGLI
jgi:hypothetical protein